MAIAPEDHLAWVLTGVTPISPRRLALEQALGAVLAEDVRAVHPLPLWANSAMDGYAVRAADTRGASLERPAKLTVLGEVAAGSSWDPEFAPGECVRIMTGAPLPSDADAVVRVEATLGDRAGAAAAAGTPGARQDPDRGALAWADRDVRITAEVLPGKDVRARGEDLAAGDLVARAGDQLTAARASALAAAGIAEVLVRESPRVAVLVTGAELQPMGASLERGQIPESNSLLMRGLLAEAGITRVSVERCPDDEAAVRDRLAKLGGTHDLIVTTGGVGPGTRDVMRIVLEDEPEVRAVRIAVRPGQPQCTGRLRSGAWIFALPGNPVSAAVSFELFVRPALRAMQGLRDTARPRLTAIAAVDWRGAPGRLQVLPVRFTASPVLTGQEAQAGEANADPEQRATDEPGQIWCVPAVHSSRVSHSVGGFGAAEGYALVGPETGDVSAGDRVTVMRVIG